MSSNPLVKWRHMSNIDLGFGLKPINHLLDMNKKVLKYRVNNLLDAIEIFPGLPEMYRIMVSVLGRENANKYVKIMARRYRKSPRSAAIRTVNIIATVLPEPQRTQFLQVVRANHY